ncbi:uncharacterized protein LOC144158692 isoform X4 [Haemaphysalis longicornis]
MEQSSQQRLPLTPALSMHSLATLVRANSRECDIPAGEISFHVLPNDKPRRSKWLRFVNFANGGERELKEVRVCSLHFRGSDYGRDPDMLALFADFVKAL